MRGRSHPMRRAASWFRRTASPSGTSRAATRPTRRTASSWTSPPDTWFLEDEGYELAVFHSHISSPPRPSRTDVENVGLWAGRPYLIYTVRTDELAGWRISDGVDRAAGSLRAGVTPRARPLPAGARGSRDLLDGEGPVHRRRVRVADERVLALLERDLERLRSRGPTLVFTFTPGPVRWKLWI